VTEEELQRWRRAREVLDSAGWVFDEYVNGTMAQILKTGAEDVEGRERLVRAARVATQIKLSLMNDVEQYEASKHMADRKEQMKERQDARREQRVN
jgi:SH3-like domain-containing protein